jgi:hypothetical protein
MLIYLLNLLEKLGPYLSSILFPSENAIKKMSDELPEEMIRYILDYHHIKCDFCHKLYFKNYGYGNEKVCAICWCYYAYGPSKYAY